MASRYSRDEGGWLGYGAAFLGYGATAMFLTAWFGGGNSRASPIGSWGWFFFVIGVFITLPAVFGKAPGGPTTLPFVGPGLRWARDKLSRRPAVPGREEPEEPEEPSTKVTPKGPPLGPPTTRLPGAVPVVEKPPEEEGIEKPPVEMGVSDFELKTIIASLESHKLTLGVDKKKLNTDIRRHKRGEINWWDDNRKSKLFGLKVAGVRLQKHKDEFEGLSALIVTLIRRTDLVQRHWQLLEKNKRNRNEVRRLKKKFTDIVSKEFPGKVIDTDEFIDNIVEQIIAIISKAPVTAPPPAEAEKPEPEKPKAKIFRRKKAPAVAAPEAAAEPEKPTVRVFRGKEAKPPAAEAPKKEAAPAPAKKAPPAPSEVEVTPGEIDKDLEEIDATLDELTEKK